MSGEDRRKPAARVYLDHGPVIRLAMPYAESKVHEKPGEPPTTRRVYMTRDELIARLKADLSDNRPIEGHDVEDNTILIPAFRVVDIVVPADTVDGMGLSDSQKKAESWIDQQGSLHDAIVLAGPDFCAAYLAGRAFSGEVLVYTTDKFAGVITGCSETGVFDVDGITKIDESDDMHFGSYSIDGIDAVLCWEFEPGRVPEDSWTVYGRQWIANLPAGAPEKLVAFRRAHE